MSVTAGKHRRFEFVEGSSDKFWELTVKGSRVEVRFGRNGTIGQASVKSFANEVIAANHADRLIRQKLGKGYREVP